VINLSIHGVISPVRTYRTVGAYGTVGPRDVDCTVELVRGLGIWSKVKLVSCA